MPDHQREFYRSENSDRWLLCVDDDRRASSTGWFNCRVGMSLKNFRRPPASVGLHFLDDHSSKLPCRIDPAISNDFDVQPPFARPFDGSGERFLAISKRFRNRSLGVLGLDDVSHLDSPRWIRSNPFPATAPPSGDEARPRPEITNAASAFATRELSFSRTRAGLGQIGASLPARAGRSVPSRRNRATPR